MTIYNITDSEYEKYIQLIIRRDQYAKEAAILEESYIREFGEEMLHLYELKVSCIELKKKIHFCQMCVNHGKKVDTEEMQGAIAEEMKSYYKKLANMQKTLVEVKNAKSHPHHVILQVKRLYREIAKMIHPDILPQSSEDEELESLWLRTVAAYNQNDKDELEQVRLLVIHRLEELGIEVDAKVDVEDIESKIEKIENEIAKIINTDPYQYKELFDSADLLEDKHEEIEDEITQYQKYEIELESILDQLLGK